MPNPLPRIKWPHTYPLCTLFGILLAFGITAATACVQVRMLQPLQRYYLGSFVKVCLLPTKQDMKFIEAWSSSNHGGYVMAVDPWIAVKRDHKETLFVLTDEAVRAGVSRPRLFAVADANPKTIRPFLEHSIYRGSLPATFRLTLTVFGLSLAFALFFGARFDEQHREAARRGIQIRGPLLMDPRKAKKYLRGDGIALFLEPSSK